MLTYCYAWTPLVIVGSLSLLALPWLGLIALMVLAVGSLVLLAGLVTMVLAAPYVVGRAVLRRWHARVAGRGRSDATLPWIRPSRRPTAPISVRATTLVTDPRARRGG